jgi:hypothetical protein
MGKINPRKHHTHLQVVGNSSHNSSEKEYHSRLIDQLPKDKHDKNDKNNDKTVAVEYENGTKIKSFDSLNGRNSLLHSDKTINSDGTVVISETANMLLYEMENQTMNSPLDSQLVHISNFTESTQFVNGIDKSGRIDGSNGKISNIGTKDHMMNISSTSIDTKNTTHLIHENKDSKTVPSEVSDIGIDGDILDVTINC